MKARSSSAAALTLAAAIALSGCAATAGDSDSMDGMHHGDTSSSEAAAAFNAADVMFAQMMIPHHEQAVEMSDTILGKEGIAEDVRALAEDIKTAQQPEIDQMESWLVEWDAGMPDSDDMNGMGHGGMMSEDDMAALESAAGAEASRLFLEQMTVHHQGAIDMSQIEVDDGRNPEAVELAKSIIDSQTAEIAMMQELLGQL